MKKLYEKSQLSFAIFWIVAYCVLMSVGDSLSVSLGVEKAVSLPVALLLSGVLMLFIKRNGLMKTYGFCKPKLSCRKMLYYIPVLALLTANFWYGVKLNLSVSETVLYILTMLLVGLLEEVIFRGLLFGAMAEDNIKSAIIVSSVTFGIGHIINLFNGSGAELLPNLLQVIYAIAAGFMFVMIYYKSKSLVVCVVAHGLFNSFSVFSNEDILTTEKRIISCVLLVAISMFYAVYLFKIREKQEDKERI